MYGDKVPGGRLRPVAFTDDPVHHTIEHDFHSGLLGIFLKELLIPQFVLVVDWRHIIRFEGQI